MPRRRNPKQTIQDPYDEFADELEVDEVPPSNIDPYEILGLPEDATTEDVKKAYRKAALDNHPDKVAPEFHAEATAKFQKIALAYAILSDARRRRLYDVTGSTDEVLGDEEDDFNWLDFYRARFTESVTEERIGNIAKEYKGSEEERQSLISAYKKYKGDLSRIYGAVMLSDILEDDDRFRVILDNEIAEGRLELYPRYEKETDEKREKAKAEERKRRAKFDKHAAGQSAKAKSKGKSGAAGSMSDLAALIQQRQQARSGNVFASLEAKYAKQNGVKRGAPASEEPPEEAFREAEERMKRARTARVAKHIESEDETDEDEEDDYYSGEDDDEEEVPKKASKTKAKPKPKSKAKAVPRKKGKAKA
jgi:DnaJ family protein C protein 9